MFACVRYYFYFHKSNKDFGVELPSKFRIILKNILEKNVVEKYVITENSKHPYPVLVPKLITKFVYAREFKRSCQQSGKKVAVETGVF